MTMAYDVDEQNRQDANKELSDKIKQVYALIRECEILADKNKLSFTLNVAYGMGGTYTSEALYREENDIPDGEEATDEYGDSYTGWFSSSQSC